MNHRFAIPTVDVQQLALPSAGNSSTTNLNAGNAYTFTGAAVNTLGVNAIQVSLHTDQNATVEVQQSPDGVNWDIIDPFNYFSEDNFGTTVQAINSYARVVVYTASTTTTYFRLQTVLCPIADPLPRALDPDGDLKTHIYGINDHYGFSAECTPMGELRAISPTRLIGASFDGTTIDPNYWTVTAAVGAAATQAGGNLILSSGTNNGGSIRVNSFRRGRYVSGSNNMARMIVQLSNTGTVNNKRRWGIAFGATMPTITDGAWFQLDGTTFSVVTMKAGVETVVSSGAFNMQLGKTFSPGIISNIYEFYWGNNWMWFVVGDEVLHKVSASTTTWADTMSHYLYFSNVNSAAIGASVDLTCRVASLKRLGPLLTQPTSRYQAGTTAGLVLKYGPGNAHELLVSGVNNNANITLYDNTAAAGTILFSTGAMGALTTPFALDLKGLPFFNGLTLVIAGANANAAVVYE